MKIIENQGHLGIDKQEIDALIAKKKFVGLNKSPRADRIILSMTSYTPRIDNVHYAVYSLLNQTFPPDKLILWLNPDCFPQREKDLPRTLLNLRKFGLTIEWCENLRPHTKYFYALQNYPDDIIVTADDDIFYRPDWLKILYDEHLKSPDCFIAHRVQRARLDPNGQLYPFRYWQDKIDRLVNPSTSLYANFMTSVGGTLYRKHFFHEDVLRKDIFMDLTPINDDVWLWAMAVLNGTKLKVPTAAMKRVILVDPEKEMHGVTLWRQNMGQGKQDVQLRQVIERYPAILERLIREAAESKPYLSVVMVVQNPANVSACVQNIFAQNFPDFELIMINLGARVEVPPLPTNFHVVNYPGGSIGDALNLGLRKAAGDYVLFADEKVVFPNGAFDIVAQAADSSNADVIHFAAHVQIEGNNGRFVLDDAPELKRDTQTLFDAPKQLRAALWFQNKLSRRLDTKIFKRDFLLRHGITFGNDLADFSFQALTQADKYLLVSQAFCFCK